MIIQSRVSFKESLGPLNHFSIEDLLIQAVEFPMWGIPCTRFGHRDKHSLIWVAVEGDQSRQGYRRVGGKHRDGTMMYICRVSGFVSGKTYNNACHYSAAGQENVITIRYEVLLSDVESEWRSFDEVKRSEIKKHAIAAGTDSNTKDSLYICLGTCLMAGIPGNCRIAETTPGKLYKNLCQYPFASGETVEGTKYQVLLTNTGYKWLKARDVSRAEIKSGAA